MKAKRRIVLPEAPPLKAASPIAAAKKPEDKAKTSFTPSEIDRPPATTENRAPPSPESEEYRKYGPKQQHNSRGSHQSPIEARNPPTQSQPKLNSNPTAQHTQVHPPPIPKPKPSGAVHGKRDLLSLCLFLLSATLYLGGKFYFAGPRDPIGSSMSSNAEPKIQDQFLVSENESPVRAPFMTPDVTLNPPIDNASATRPTASSTREQTLTSHDSETRQATTTKEPPPRPKPLTKTKSLKDWIELAEQGDVYAQSQLGHMYATGQGAPRNYDEALRWNFMAAKAGSARAQSNLGVAYGNGQGVSSDAIEAYAWWYVAASNGNSAARSNMKKFDAHRTLTDQQKARAIARAGVLSGSLRN